jgi:hypothetical protein
MDSNHFYYAPAAYPCLKKFQVQSFKFQVVLIPQTFPLFYYSLSNKLYERFVVVIVYSYACFILILSL